MSRTPTSHAPFGFAAMAIVSAVLATALLTAAPVQAQHQLPTNFQDQSLISGLDAPVSFAFLPDGRVLLNELKTGKVRMIVGGAIASTDPVFTIDSLETAGEETGLLGIAIDPRWPSSPYVYL